MFPVINHCSAATLFALFVVAALPAQVTATATTWYSSRVSANSARKSLPGNTNVSNGYTLSVSDAQCQASASKTLTITRSGGSIDAKLHASVSTNNFFCGASADSVGTIILTLRAPKPTPGRLTLASSVRLYKGAASVVNGYSNLYFGPPYRPGLNGNGTITLDVVIGPQGLPLMLSGACSAKNWANATSEQQVRFTPTGSRFQVIGAPCGGPVLQSRFTPRELVLEVSGAPTGQFAVLGFGTKDPSFKIPPAGCFLHTDLLVVVGLSVNSQGEVKLKVPLSQPVTGSFTMQFLISSQGAWRSSNGLRLRL